MDNPMVFTEVDDPFSRFHCDPETVTCCNCGMEYECEDDYDDCDDHYCEECGWFHGGWDL